MGTNSRPSFRITPPILDLIEVLLEAPWGGIHGWELMKKTQRTGATVYQNLERLTEVGWVGRRWEAENPDPSKPRRRFYWIEGQHIASARALLAERRPAKAHQGRTGPKPGLAFRVWGCGLLGGR